MPAGAPCALIIDKIFRKSLRIISNLLRFYSGQIRDKLSDKLEGHLWLRKEWCDHRDYMLKKICVLARYCIVLCVISTFVLLYQSFEKSISAEYKVRIAAAELRRKLSDVTVEIASPSESSLKLTLNDSVMSSFNESSRSLTFNDSLRSSLNQSLRPTINENLGSILNESLQSSHNETKQLLEMLRKKGVLTIGGSGYYEGRYKPLRNFNESQIDSIVTAFGIPNLNSSNFKEQMLACTGLTLVKAKKPVNITNGGNVVMPKHFQKCKSMSFQKTGKTVALLSFPGSGNSWVRQLLETTTGIYTGTYKDCDDFYISNGMIGEGVYTDNVIAVKIHHTNANDLKWLYGHSIIYVVRNPFDTILAEWNRWQSALKNHDTAHLSTTTVFGK